MKENSRNIYSGDASDSAARARIVRGVEEIKCAFTKDATEVEEGQCTFGGCKVNMYYLLFYPLYCDTSF